MRCRWSASWLRWCSRSGAKSRVPRLLLISAKAGYQTEAFAAAAVRQGVDLDLATNRCHHLDDPWRDGALAVDFDGPELEPQNWDGIVAVGDQAAIVAAILAERFGLRFHPRDAVNACRRKFELRERFRNAGLLTPRFSRVTRRGKMIERPHEIEFPLVMKPMGLSASRGVIRADNEEEFGAAFARIRSLLFWHARSRARRGERIHTSRGIHPRAGVCDRGHHDAWTFACDGDFRQAQSA